MILAGTPATTVLAGTSLDTKQLRKPHGSFYAFDYFMIFRIIHSDRLARLEPLKDVW